MKRYSLYLILPVLAAVALAGCKNDDPSDHDFGNRVYVDTRTPATTTYLTGMVDALSQTIRATMVEPAAREVELTFAPDESQVRTYNLAYYDEAVMLPADYYELPDPVAKITRGNITSTDVQVNFKQLLQLPTDRVYVLPVTMTRAEHVAMLDRQRTVYYVFREGALINVVGNISKKWLDVDWKKPSVVTGLDQLTMEALIRVDKFDRMISTVMGIEGEFLIRIGDSGINSNQLQVATSNGNVPSSKSTKLELPTGEWIHIAATFDRTQGSKVQIYVNGELCVEGLTRHNRAVNLGRYVAVADETDASRGFHIGYAYSADRYLDGAIAEARIWNRVLTAEEINSKNHFYYVEPDADGLVAYWKFDDGTGSVVKDHTANGNDATGNKTLSWIDVSLPVK